MAKNNSAAKDQQRREHWRRLVGRWRAGGLSQAAFCRQERINVWQFAWWKKRLGSSGSASNGEPGGAPGCSFVPVQIVAEAVRPAGELELTLPGGRILRFGIDVATDKLAGIVAALEGALRQAGDLREVRSC
jgi:hypothetical protein